ncbi:MAG: hypothetical protein WBP12_03350 [Candidatus Saccharimonas sp.]
MSFSKISDIPGLSPREIAKLQDMVGERLAQDDEAARRKAFLNERLHPTLSELTERLGGRPRGLWCWLRFRRHTFARYYSGTRGYGHGYKLCKTCGYDTKSSYFGSARPLIPG